MRPKRREGRRPARDVAAAEATTKAERETLAKTIRYTGSAFHKLKAADYGLTPPRSPRPSKSACDDRRAIPLREATALFRKGILKGMFSPPPDGGLPKYVWAVDDQSEVYEAKIGGDGTEYHGYRLGDDDQDMRRLVLKEWRRR